MKSTFLISTFALSLLLIFSGCNNQEEKKAVKEDTKVEQTTETTAKAEQKEAIADKDLTAVVVNLFDGVRESNKEKISSALTKEAVFVSYETLKGNK